MNEFLHDQTNRVKDKNINFTIVPNKGNEIEQKWEEAFAKDISKSQKRKMKFKQSMWNVFSWGKIECLKEQRAIEAFNQQEKRGCYLIYAGGEEAIYIPKAGRIKAKDIIHTSSQGEDSDNTDTGQPASIPSVSYLMDLYIVDEDFTWTYVLTHEEDCGPYFHKP